MVKRVNTAQPSSLPRHNASQFGFSSPGTLGRRFSYLFLRIFSPHDFPVVIPCHSIFPTWASEYIAAYSDVIFRAAWDAVGSQEPLRADCSWNPDSKCGTEHLKVLSCASFSQSLIQLVADRKWSKVFYFDNFVLIRALFIYISTQKQPLQAAKCWEILAFL